MGASETLPPTPSYAQPEQSWAPPPSPSGWDQQAAPAWPQQQPAYGAPIAYGQQTNGMAIASMVLGILWIWWIGSILALIFGYVAKSQIDRSGGREGGRGMATAGIVLGWIGVGILLTIIVVGIITNNNDSGGF